MKKIFKDEKLIIALKLLVAGAILKWLYSSGKLDFKSALVFFSHPERLILVFILVSLQIFIGSFRWKTLLEIKTKRSYSQLKFLGLQWIGQLFSSILPGAVTGDIIKLGYVTKMDHSLSKRYLLLSVFLDRLMGVVGLLFVSGVGSLVYYSDIVALGPEMKHVLKINLIMFLFAIGFVAAFFVPSSLVTKIKQKMTKKLLSDAIATVEVFGQSKMQIIKLVALSTFSHILAIIIFQIINIDQYESAIRLRDLATIIPIGQITVSIPISPAGLGVGHFAYQKLFSFIHQTNGATLFNNFWLIVLMVNLFGIIPYLFLKTHKVYGNE